MKLYNNFFRNLFFCFVCLSANNELTVQDIRSLSLRSISPCKKLNWMILNKSIFKDSYEILKESGDIKAKDAVGNSMIFYAAWFGNIDLINALLVRGINPHERNKLNFTAYNVLERYYPEMIEGVNRLYNETIIMKKKAKLFNNFDCSKL